MTKKKVGLYLGISSVGVAVKEGKNLLYLNSADLSSIEAKDSEILDENLHWQALIRKTFRQANVESKEVSLTLADRDFIIRSLELPLMNKKEIESSLIYEIEKYIPFKPEELVWDYQYSRIPKEKKVNVSFIGIRKSSLEQTKKILSNIDFQVTTIEPACLSLARMLKSTKETKDSENFALLDLTLQEVYLTFFQNDLPVFNRYLNMKEKEGKLDLEHFIEAVNFSFQYFRREFKGGKLDRIFIISNLPELDKLSDSLKETLSLDVKKVTPYELTSRQQSSLESLKALGCVSRDDYPYKFKPVLRGFEETKMAETPITGEIAWQWGLIGSVVAASVAVCFFVSLFFNNTLSLAQEEFKRKEKTLQLPAELQQVGWQNIETMIDKKQNKIQQLKQLKKEDIELSSFLRLLIDENVMPDKMWLDSIRISKVSEKNYTIEIKGYVYRDNDYQERMGVNDFVANLKSEMPTNSLFEIVEVSSTDRKQIRDFGVTQFTISLR
ncbi:MAG: pilus assembly protein PilM [Candidatus Omnitrophica bacterium]|nr:pilus assembly protein PilM [Candidatus Omnitrophota bacterium]